MRRHQLSQPPSGAPEGTIWFGGPVDRFRITLRIASAELDPDHITALLGCSPTRSRRKGDPVNDSPGAAMLAQKARWSLSIDSDACGDGDVEDGIRMLWQRLTPDLGVWDRLSEVCAMDVFCGVFVEAKNRGFELSAEACRMLADRHVSVGFDLYFDPPGKTATE
ncbi:MAG TPA: DUF4279 domain-containing protein [Bryobacteraceae bacterium]|nr:DUF4279 domain-containing protein [Bryobacteraceae bacterium]